MKRAIHGSALVSVVAIAGWSVLACGCSDRMELEESDGAADGDLQVSASSGTTTATAGETSAMDTSEEPIDVSRFLGVFHNENAAVPLGEPVDNPGDPTLTNVEIRADGTASMTMETCSVLAGTFEIEWRWEASPGPVLEFFPGAGESSLRFMALTDAESVRALPVGSCDFQFELDGELYPYETFHPGRACWVNRCEPTWVVEIDYCEGEEPVVCP